MGEMGQVDVHYLVFKVVSNVVAVAELDHRTGRYSASIGVVTDVNDNAEITEVAETGTGLPEAVAEAIFGAKIKKIEAAQNRPTEEVKP